ncbi:PLP-dependent transferase, partial [Paenibacillus xylanexedens]|uniref:PLP-dependent transferase n=1 Tax=Paenibacillus xylanexedens TaxID=528191 RepID=UPI0021B3FC10
MIDSGRKYVGGENDVLGGLMIRKGEGLWGEMGLVDNWIGGVLCGSECYELMKGMKRVGVGMEGDEENGCERGGFRSFGWICF